MAPPTGLEPVTPWLTVRCSTDWAKEECVKILFSETMKHAASRLIFSRIGTLPNSFRFAKYRKYVGDIYNKTKADDSGKTLCRLLHLCRLWAIVPARLQASIVATAKLNFCVRNGNRWTLCVWITDLCQRWAIVPARLQASIVATAKLNFCVRNGNRWTLCVWNTDCLKQVFPLLLSHVENPNKRIL